MSDVNDRTDELYVIEYKELLFFLFVFIFILVTLFPKELVKKELFSQNDKDYRLSLVYIQDLLKKEPNNLSLQLLLAKKALLAGRNRLACKSAQKLMKNKEKDIANEALLIAFEACKQEYFNTKEEKRKEHLRAKIAKFFDMIYKKRLYDEDSAQWYGDARLAKNDEAAFFFLQRLLQKKQGDLEKIEEAFYLASALRKDKEALEYLDILIQRDPRHHDKWVRAKYYILMRNKMYSDAERLLQKEAKSSLEFAKMLASFYMMQKEYRKASRSYLALMERSSGYEQKKEYLVRAVDALRAGGYATAAAKLLKRFESAYMHEKKMREYMLKVYLAANRLDFAHGLAKRTLYMLKRERGL